MPDQQTWYDEAAGNATLVVACCLREREGDGRSHFTHHFPKEELMLTAEETQMVENRVLPLSRSIVNGMQHNGKAYLIPGSELRFSAPVQAAAAFLARTELLQDGFVGVHWRSEQIHHKGASFYSSCTIVCSS